jgi:hypothetical protein
MLFQSIARIAGLSAALVAVIVVATIVLVRQPSFSKAPRLVKGRADPARLRTDVAFLTRDASPRDVQHPDKLELAAEHISAQLSKTGAAVANQPYTVHGRTFRNVVARLGPGGPGALVVGAHYDAFTDTLETLDFERMAQVVTGVANAAVALCRQPSR